ncbi:MAG: hypothetical protein H7301_03030 [Cryobacterium sp.]|nr:hypothetical protein [Oligoflexia bacterium]
MAEARKIFLQVAMKVEAEPLLSALVAVRIAPDWCPGLPFEFYQANHRGLEITFGLPGNDPVHSFDSIGSVPAGLLAYLGITHLQPDLVLNAGTCGGFHSLHHRISEVFIGTRFVAFHHRRSSIPAMQNYGFGKYPVANSAELRNALKLSEGIVSSGDALDYSDDDRVYMKQSGATLKEMEAAAIGWACHFFGTPLLLVKSVTDLVDHPDDTASQFLRNYARAADTLKIEVLRILDYLAENSSDPVWNHSAISDT